jgi:hypothetical protein
MTEFQPTNIRVIEIVGLASVNAKNDSIMTNERAAA